MSRPSSARASCSSADRRLASTLSRWFAASARDLPWRRRRDGYTALVAEAMLQQTQVARVVERYETFLRRFPDIATLAAADEQDVLAAWQGLGYYRRARSLHAAARTVRDELDGRLPEMAAELVRLPGVGRYSAGAIASMVHGEATPVVDGNVQRVLARLAGRREPTDNGAFARWCWQRAGQLVAATDDPGTFNEATMELGATICTPRTPDCGQCPIARFCEAKKAGLQHEIPPAKTAAARIAVHHHAVVIRRGGRILLEQRPASGLWSKMWQTPTIEARLALKMDQVESALPVRVMSMRAVDRFVHNTTHRRITFHVYEARSRARRGVWREPDELADLPMSSAQRRVMAMVDGV
jgi:A/G-specific adenine glycosylase